jgi:hypothetical protein
MPLFGLSQTELEKRKKIASEIWDLCCLAAPELYIDMQRVCLMEAFDLVYFKSEFHKQKREFCIINIFGHNLNDPKGTFDYTYIWDDWRRLRPIIAKYLGKEYHGILPLDRQYHVSVGRYRLGLANLPALQDQERPKALPREWWDNHPDREAQMRRLASNWWGRKAASYTYEDLHVQTYTGT